MDFSVKQGQAEAWVPAPQEAEIVGGVGLARLPFLVANPAAAAVVGAVVVISSVARWILDWGDERR